MVLQNCVKALLIIFILGIAPKAYAEEVIQEEDLALSFGGEEFVSITTGQKHLISKAPIVTIIMSEDIKRMGRLI